MKRQNETNTPSENNKSKNGCKSKSNNRSRKNYNSRKKTGTSSSKSNEDTKMDINKDDINDSTFYYTDMTLRDQLTDYSINAMLGVPVRLGQYRASLSDSPTDLKYAVPSMMCIDINPALETDLLISRMGGRTSAGIYKAALKNYNMLTASNARNFNYDTTDTTMLIVATTQLYALVGHIRRIFGCMFKYSYRNRDLPENLITGLDVNYVDLRQHAANYRIRFNTIINGINKIPVPANIAYINKWAGMYMNIYVDEPNVPTAQRYMLKPYSIWKFNETKSDAGVGLDTVVISGSKTMGQILDILEECVDAILTSSTFNYIFPDILRMADKSGLPTLSLPMLLEGYETPELYSDEFNLWVDNMEVTGTPIDTPLESGLPGKNDVQTNVNDLTIKYAPRFAWRQVDSNLLLNFYMPNPDAEMRVAATRLKKFTSWFTGQEETNQVGIVCGDAYVTGLKILTTNPRYNEHTWLAFDNGDFAWTYDNIAFIQAFKWGLLTQFRFAPKVLFHNTSDTDSLNCAYIGDIGYYTTIDSYTLQEMFDAEWIGLLEMR